MNKIISVAIVVMLGSCGGNNPPGPQPTPPPPTDPTFFQDMLLRADGPSAFKNLKGEPVEFRGAISCCMPPDWGGGSGWPFNVDPAWQDYAAQQFNANFFHARSGPFLGSVETEFVGVGGPYKVVDGQR
ncbi:MAG TPA: hypothetical protein VM537_21040, partial [Anaerolineae bacterium]|nr:hypothetical protein [Anaerolineae bacterium]